jgi:hypothetical protein
MRIDVIEVIRVDPQQVYRGNQLVRLLGPHDLRLRIKNDSQHEITIHSVQIEPDAQETYTEDPSQPVEKTIMPGGSEEFGFVLNVYAERASAPPENALDYVKLTLACSNEEKDFFETGSYPVTHQRSGS